MQNSMITTVRSLLQRVTMQGKCSSAHNISRRRNCTIWKRCREYMKIVNILCYIQSCHWGCLDMRMRLSAVATILCRFVTLTHPHELSIVGAHVRPDCVLENGSPTILSDSYLIGCNNNRSSHLSHKMLTLAVAAEALIRLHFSVTRMGSRGTFVPGRPVRSEFSSGPT